MRVTKSSKIVGKVGKPWHGKAVLRDPDTGLEIGKAWMEDVLATDKRDAERKIREQAEWLSRADAARLNGVVFIYGVERVKEVEEPSGQ